MQYSLRNTTCKTRKLANPTPAPPVVRWIINFHDKEHPFGRENCFVDDWTFGMIREDLGICGSDPFILFYSSERKGATAANREYVGEEFEQERVIRRGGRSEP